MHLVRRPNVNPPPQDRALAQQLRGACIVFGAIMAGAFCVTALAYGLRRIGVTPEFERNRLAERSESAAYAAMLDEENGLLAYLLTRDVRFIEPYTRGEEAVSYTHLRAHETVL